VCGADCPETVCDCPACGACCVGPAPIAYYNIGLTGFTDDDLNGGWVWTWTEGCTWEAVCGDKTSTLEWVENSGVDAVWRLTHDTFVYEVLAADWGCCTGNVLDIVTPSGDAPSQITIDPAGACSEDDCVDDDWPNTLTAEVTVTMALGGENPFPAGPFTLTKNYPVDPEDWTPADGWESAEYELYSGAFTTLRFHCNEDGAEGGCMGFTTGSSDFTPVDLGGGASPEDIDECSCSPVAFTGSAAGPFNCAGAPSCLWGPIGATASNVTVTITE
jgi:hypothetical protein